MAEIIEDGIQSRHYQRRWLLKVVTGLRTDPTVMRINLPLLGVSLDAKAMVADVAANYPGSHLGETRLGRAGQVRSSSLSLSTKRQPAIPVLVCRPGRADDRR